MRAIHDLSNFIFSILWGTESDENISKYSVLNNRLSFWLYFSVAFWVLLNEVKNNLLIVSSIKNHSICIIKVTFTALRSPVNGQVTLSESPSNEQSILHIFIRHSTCSYIHKSNIIDITNYTRFRMLIRLINITEFLYTFTFETFNI